MIVFRESSTSEIEWAIDEEGILSFWQDGEEIPPDRVRLLVKNSLEGKDAFKYAQSLSGMPGSRSRSGSIPIIVPPTSNSPYGMRRLDEF
jgi:hypothetical protein